MKIRAKLALYAGMFAVIAMIVSGCGGSDEMAAMEKQEIAPPQVRNIAFEGPVNHINAVCISGTGASRILWLGTRGGLYRASLGDSDIPEAGDFQPVNFSPLKGREVMSVVAGADGNVIAGTERGISRVTSTGVATYDPGPVLSAFVHPADNSLWIGTLGRGAWRQPAGSSIGSGWTQMSSESISAWNHPEISRDIDRVYSFGTDGQDMWVGTGDGLLMKRGNQWQLYFGEHRRMSMTGTINVSPGNSILPGNRISAMVWDGDRTLYAGVSGGVVVITQGSGITRVYTADMRVNETVDNRIQTVTIPGNSPLAGAWVNDLDIDEYGRLWAATSTGLSVKHGEKWTSLNVGDGLVSQRCNAVTADGAGVWVGTDSGLIRVEMSTEWSEKGEK